MAIHCAAAERGVLIKKKEKKVQQHLLRPSDVPVGWPNEEIQNVERCDEFKQKHTCKDMQWAYTISNGINLSLHLSVQNKHQTQ